MNAKWFCRNGKVQIGPFSSHELRQLVGVQIVRPTTLVRIQSMVRWVEAISVRGLFPGHPAPAAHASEVN